MRGEFFGHVISVRPLQDDGVSSGVLEFFSPRPSPLKPSSDYAGAANDWPIARANSLRSRAPTRAAARYMCPSTVRTDS